jgi:hypothetical protein
MPPGVLCKVSTIAGLPFALSSLVTVGQLTVVPKLGPLDHVELVALRKEVKMKVSPEESTRRMGTMGVAGRVTPVFRAAMAVSFHIVMVPE